VSPHVQYGIACLIIRDVVGSVPCSDEWEIGVTWCKRGHGTTVGIVTRPGPPWETLALLWCCDYLS
jgi:hypothetical protein